MTAANQFNEVETGSEPTKVSRSGSAAIQKWHDASSLRQGRSAPLREW
jgi:hypothetical protein